MSIQDESFPQDEFLDLNFSSNSGKLLQFPNHRRQKLKSEDPSTSTNTSSSSNDQNSSAESRTERSSVLSAKTAASDPTGLTDHDLQTFNSNNIENHSNKATSYQDIHTTYTKKRYKHVESKVKQYIASLHAEEQKRRDETKFGRHQSLPETLSENNHKEHCTRRLSADHFDDGRLYELNSNNGRHVSCEENGTHSDDYIDKATYAQLITENERIQSYSDYLQNKLEEKTGEIIRLKRNVDFMRIELSNCKDKLKHQSSKSGSRSIGFGAGHSLSNTIFYSLDTDVKGTQTEITQPPTPGELNRTASLVTSDMFITPTRTIANNKLIDISTGVEVSAAGISGNNMNILDNTISATQPLSLTITTMAEYKRSEENQNLNNRRGGLFQQALSLNEENDLLPSVNVINNNSQSSYLSSDSAIDIETAESGSPKVISPSRGHRQVRRKEFIYFKNESGDITTIEALNSSISFDDNVLTTSVLTIGTKSRTKIKKRSSSSRLSWLRLFAPCTRCKDQNQTLESSTESEQNGTQIPLLKNTIANNIQ